MPAAAPARPRTSRGAAYYLVFTWGVVGVALLLLRAITRMTPIALEPILAGSLSGLHVGILVAWVAFNAYGEGYRAFQKSFCPRVVARADHLARNPHPLHAALAPLYCLSLFHANRRGLTVAWVMIVVITAFVFLLRITPQPWRGIVDAGVVVALVWGLVALFAFSAKSLAGHPPRARMNLPGS